MSKKTKLRRKKKGKWNKPLVILLCVTAMIIVITFSVLNQRNPQSPQPPKEAANEYFSFSQGLAVATPNDPENSTILIDQAGFYITAVGGNATNVHVRPLQGNVPLEETPRIDELIQGEAVEVGPITYPYKVLSTKEAEGWPILFKITCNEAEGEVTVYIERFVQLGSSS
jgi:hypothetical protein